MRVRLLLSVALLGISLVQVSAAAPAATRVDGVSQCSKTDCGDATPVSEGTIVAGSIRIRLTADGGIGLLEYVRLEARPPGTYRYICLKQWYGGGNQTLSTTFDWSSADWPKPSPDWGCPEAEPHYHGEPSQDGAYALRVVAKDVNDSTIAKSADFAVRLANPPRSPSWFQDPGAQRAQDGSPTVLLRWNQNREPDVSEYHFIRVGPTGTVREFAVDAAQPPNQGCYKTTSILYACVDRDFTGQPSGVYRYALVSLRPAPGADLRCSLTQAACLESAPSAQRAVTVTVPQAVATASVAPSPATSFSPGAQPSQSAPSSVPTTQAAAQAVDQAAAQSRRAGLRSHAAPGAAAAVLAFGVGCALMVTRRKESRSGASKVDA